MVILLFLLPCLLFFSEIIMHFFSSFDKDFNSSLLENGHSILRECWHLIDLFWEYWRKIYKIHFH